MANWTTIQNNAIKAAEGELGGNWQTVAKGATGAVIALVQVAKHVEASDMPNDEKEFLLAQQKDAVRNVLTAYKAISLAVAINAINAALQVILDAVPGLFKIP